ncbi:DUF1501 domain-containing protein [soil metagenome]
MFRQTSPISSSLSRREWLTQAGMGFGGLALADMMNGRVQASEGGLPGMPHFAPKAKRVIFLFMSGGPSQLESFDYKPLLFKHQGEELPQSYLKGKRPAGMAGSQSSFPMIGSTFGFKQYGQSGAWISDVFPETAKVADDLCFIKSMTSEAVNHDPALTFMQTGAPLPGRPSIGSWINYGLGTDNRDLPSFIVLISKRPVDQPLSYRLWDSGFLPSQYQGVPFRAGKDAVLYLSEPEGISRTATRQMLDTLKEMHLHQFTTRPDAEITSRIEQYEMAFRMQNSVPDATDLSKEPESVFSLYGPDAKTPGSFASNCILARRLAERDVKFIQLYHPGWDHHGGLPASYPGCAKEIDQPCAALIQDLKQRDMLKDTLVVWGGEFGRTNYSQGSFSTKSKTYGRDHHRECFTYWMAGGGIKGGISYGETDDLGYEVAKDAVTVNDFHATLLHLLGIDHEKFTYRFQGRDFRLTDVAGKVVKGILA